MARLTAKQARFVDEYLVDLNATQAAIRAGYSKRTARQIGQQNLSKLDIQEKIAEAQRERSERTRLSQDQVVEELARIAFSDLRDYAEWTATSVRLKPSDGLTDEKAGAVAEVSRTQHGLRVRLHGKLEALHLLGKHLGMFTDRSENPNVDLNALSDHQLQRIVDGEPIYSVLASAG